MTTIRKVVLLVLGAAIVAAGVLIIGVRTKSKAVLVPFTRLQRDRLNAPALRTAGESGDRNGVIYHRGRTSGRELQTPVTPIASDDGFIIGLPYGRETQWLKNVLAAGEATVRYQGEMVRVTDPRIVEASELQHQFATAERVMQAVFGVNEYLVLTRV
ncbi:nitroreductase family deazaflavin-dependent oxidoreductase [Smaragdicoccus niigatensis]|uniref:nitroreductase family deazaflavin-dependent oxidoreductase n=1 Tax=Smaragdicoccus niigatensis TaxID=359359 RepID=UPI00036019E1|nr:nitroreductase family deazaflavin-dependent oxidoreductase [Smaragdicoccus niigatensis]